MKSLKRVLIVGAFFCLLLPTEAFAIQNVSITESHLQRNPTILRMVNTSYANVSLNIDAKGKAEVFVEVIGYKGKTTKLEASVELQQYTNGRWKSIQSFSQTVYSHILEAARSGTISRGYSYRVVATIKAFNGSSSETQTIVSKVKKY